MSTNKQIPLISNSSFWKTAIADADITDPADRHVYCRGEYTKQYFFLSNLRRQMDKLIDESRARIEQFYSEITHKRIINKDYINKLKIKYYHRVFFIIFKI